MYSIIELFSEIQRQIIMHNELYIDKSTLKPITNE